MAKTEASVAITGFGGLDSPDSGAAIARALRLAKDQPIRIHALGYDWKITGAWMKGAVDEVSLLPPVAEGDEAMLQRIRDIHARAPLDILIPSLPLDIPVFARLAGPLGEIGIRTLLPEPESVYAVCHAELAGFIFRTGIPALATQTVADIESVPAVAEKLGYPLTVLGSLTGGAIAHNDDQALRAARAFDGYWGGGVALQQRVAGDEFSVAVLAGADGNCAGTVAIRKLAVDDNAHVECGCVVCDPQLEEMAEKIVRVLNWRGPLHLEFVRPPGALDPLLKNIQRGFPEWITQSGHAGCNLPLRLVDLLTGRNSRDSETVTAGAMFVRGIEEAAIPLDNLLQFREHGTAAGIGLNGQHRKIAGDFVLDLPRDGLRVAVTGISTFDMINPGLGVARALRQHPDVEHLIGLNYGTFDSGCFQHGLFDGVFRLPITTDTSQLLERIREIHARMPFDVLIPCLDGELPRFIALQEAIEELGIRMLLPGQRAFERRDKLALFGNGTEQDWQGFRIPHGLLATSEAEVIDAACAIGLPVVVKGPMSGCFHVHTLEDARQAWWLLQEQGIGQAIVQDRIDGEIFAVAAVCNRDSSVLHSFTLKKLAICGRGSTWMGLHTRQPQLEAALARFLDHIDWVGPVEGEFVHDSLNDTYHLFEVNPRFTGWISYSNYVGCNHPLLAADAALGRKSRHLEHIENTVFMRSSIDFPIRATDLATLSIHGGIQTKQ